MDLATIPWAQGSLVTIALAIIVATVGMVLRGLLIPKSTHEAMIAVLQQRAEEKAEEAREYKAAWLAVEQTRQEQDRQLAELMELGRTTVAIIRSLDARAGGRRDEEQHVET